MDKLSEAQLKIIDDLTDWYRRDSREMQYVTLGGYAGTGKTTLIGYLRNRIFQLDNGIKVGFAAYTGKAARVLNTKIKALKALYKGDSIGTIHSLIYSPIINSQEQIVGWKQKDKIDPDLIIIDEASMVDPFIWQHLVSYQKPIIAIGDHGQLPPISENFNLMQKPVLKLEQIYRQAENNPIIELSIMARTAGKIPPGRYGKTVAKYDRNNDETNEILGEMLANYNKETLILTGFNHTRQKINSHIRASLGFETPEPQSGDRVICLRNNHKENIFNGMLGTVISIADKGDDRYQAEIAMDDEPGTYSGYISKKQFNSEPINFTDKRKFVRDVDLFDFGYALTVHKAQGSQARRVILIEERFSKMDDQMWKRWLYTAVTRAESELYIFG
jgi:ATP-dependent exoDNAse (exonuclease V) alpha subunit